MADLRIVDAPVLLQESITDDVKMPTGGLGNFSIRLGDIVWYVVTKEQLANKNYVDLSSKGVKDSLDEHIADKANPHNVTKVQVGLGNVDNTADIDKPVSNAVSSAIITATNDMATKAYVNSKDGDLSTLTTTDKTSLVKAVNEIHDVTKGVVALYDKNVGAGANGRTAELIVDKSGATQQQVNYNGGSKWHSRVGGYKLNERVVLANGDIVKSTIDGNTVDPNVDMTGWVNTGSAENISNSVYVPNNAQAGIIGGTFRGYVDGVRFIEDTAHAPIGMTGISKADNYTVRLEHANSFGKVGTLNLTADESFTSMGVMSGASVAQGYSLAKVIAPLYVTIKGDGTITKVSPLFEGSVATIAGHNPAGGILRFSHPLKSVGAHQAIAVNRSFADNIARPVNFGIFNNDGGTYTQINVYDDPPDNNVWIRYNNTSAAFEVAQGINKAQFSLTYNASTGGLLITHPAVKTGAYLTIPTITPYNTNKRYAVYSVGTTQTGILCYAPDGTVVKNLNVADWNFFFSIKPSVNERVLSAIPATAEFTVFVGNCYVPVDNLQKVPSGNIWFYGAMNK